MKAVVIACNTSTAHALDALHAASPVPVIGVIEPGAHAAVTASRGGSPRRHRHGGHHREQRLRPAIQGIRPGARVEQRACPLFVPLVEEGWFEHPAAELIAAEYLAPLREIGVGVAGARVHPLPAAPPAAAAGDGARGAADRQRGSHRGWPRDPLRSRRNRGAERRQPRASLRGERRRGPLPAGRARGSSASGSARPSWWRWTSPAELRSSRRLRPSHRETESVEPGPGIEILPRPADPRDQHGAVGMTHDDEPEPRLPRQQRFRPCLLLRGGPPPLASPRPWHGRPGGAEQVHQPETEVRVQGAVDGGRGRMVDDAGGARRPGGAFRSVRRRESRPPRDGRCRT